MIVFTATRAQKQLAEYLTRRRLDMNLTQVGLSKRSGVPVGTLRDFERKGKISLESFLKLLNVLGGLEEIVEAVKPVPVQFNSIDEVLSSKQKAPRQRGHRT